MGTVTSSCIQASGTLVAQLWVQYLHCQWAPFETVLSLVYKYLMTILWPDDNTIYRHALDVKN